MEVKLWKRNRLCIVAMLLALALALAACGGDEDDEGDASESLSPGAETEAPAAGVDLNAGPDLDLNLNTNSGTQLPGCSDPDAEDCPAPVQMQLDGTISDSGISINYPTRYFNALTGDENAQGVPIQLEPNDTYAFENEAVFQVYFEDSVEQAVSSLNEPISAPWTAQQVGDGTIAVQKDESQDPPVNTIIGAFPASNERVVVLKLTVDGKYGWDLFSRVYEAMLNTLTVTVEPAAESSQ